MTEETNNGGQRLRWWKQDETAVAAIGGVSEISRSKPVENEIVLPDVGQELEDEALRRTASNTPAGLVEIYPKLQASNVKMLKSVTIFTVLVAAFSAVQAIILHDPKELILFPCAMLELAAVIMLMRQITRKQKQPIFTMTREGVEVHTLIQNIGLLRWDEIEEIGVYNFGDRCIGIVPSDTEALCRRLPAAQAFLVRSNANFCRLFPRRMRKALAPIWLSQQVLPMPVDELVEQIAKFRRENVV